MINESREGAMPKAAASARRTASFALPCSGGAVTAIRYSVGELRSTDSCRALGVTRTVILIGRTANECAPQ